MDDPSIIERYPLRCRMVPTFALGIGVTVAIVAIAIGVGVLRGREQTASPVVWGVQIGIIAVVWLPFAALLLVAARSTWFYLYTYRINGCRIESVAPLSRRVDSVDVREIRTVTTFVVFGEWQPGDARVGHFLTDEHGSGIRLSEALPLWRWVSGQCLEAALQPRPHPWWEITR